MHSGSLKADEEMASQKKIIVEAWRSYKFYFTTGISFKRIDGDIRLCHDIFITIKASAGWFIMKLDFDFWTANCEDDPKPASKDTALWACLLEVLSSSSSVDEFVLKLVLTGNPIESFAEKTSQLYLKTCEAAGKFETDFVMEEARQICKQLKQAKEALRSRNNLVNLSN